VEAFGNVVVQGNLIVGGVVFLVITLIQFIVIAKGAERVAEVSARFTLDALPGKQMSIDADVRAGLIDFEEARKKRQALQTESRFYGALDGAMKFVKGDAIAGIVITAINIVGGLLVGLMVHELEIQTAVSRYTILTIGDGLLSQIPSLLNSLAAGMVVTRVSRGDGVPLARELLAQIGQVRSGKILIGVLALLLAFVSELPSLPFVCLSALLLVSAAFSSEHKQDKKPVAPRIFDPKLPAVLTIEIAKNLAEQVVKDKNALVAFEEFRQKVFSRTGIILLAPEIKFASELESSYRILLRGVPVVEKKGIQAVQTIIQEVIRDLEQLVSKHATELVDDLLTRRTLDHFESHASDLVTAAVPTAISVTQLTEILRQLAAEGVSFVNFDLVLQAVAEHGARASNERVLLEEVRIALRRVISAKFTDESGQLEAYFLDPILDIALSQCDQEQLQLDAQDLEPVFLQLEEANEGSGVVVLCSRKARALFKRCIEARQIDLAVLAHEEIVAETKIVNRGVLEITDCGSKEQLVENLAA
ncbi:MAG: FHIPEP family type III secretion protein, partial [Bdellovibrionales bacterium]|nr:FHIPEP family type III secretion protein [Bdellovibrionales bacterium]